MENQIEENKIELQKGINDATEIEDNTTGM